MEKIVKAFFNGLENFIGSTKVHVLIGLYMLCDILPHLPDAVAKKIVDKVMNLLGLGD